MDTDGWMDVSTSLCTCGCTSQPVVVLFSLRFVLCCFLLLCLLCFALLCFALLCFAWLCFAWLCLASLGTRTPPPFLSNFPHSYTCLVGWELIVAGCASAAEVADADCVADAVPLFSPFLLPPLFLHSLSLSLSLSPSSCPAQSLYQSLNQ